MTSPAPTIADQYRSADTPLPDPNLGWNTYGKGVESIGRDGAPEPIEIPETGDDQSLVRVDAVGLCFSDVKLIRQGGDHPKLYGRDLGTEPTRLGYEATVSVIEVGADIADTYHQASDWPFSPTSTWTGAAPPAATRFPAG